MRNLVLCLLFLSTPVVTLAQTMSYAERGELARTQAWQDRIQMATTAAAMLALKADPESENYERNIRLAREYLRNQEYIASKVAWMVLVSDTVTETTTDKELTTLIAQQWPTFSTLFVTPSVVPLPTPPDP